MSAARTVAVTIRGRVQGVGYRAWMRDEARALGLHGHVRNRPDGGVAALVSGEPEAVGRLLAACRRGPPGARVEDVTEAPSTEVPAAGFEIRYA
ncbi:acylphosphatase [Methylobacterium oryzihabitans]|uniref:acylphosphatase n=1 Tax=Methylobacterium oryzihabitans TaxID=2499852 RepID=A0A437P4H0_9HYPH|nr:acylphosphatase [Methylobacterium oryzihabitans]RVU17169.1 acylphosphatase [Methylobacterium oryzihabitans]